MQKTAFLCQLYLCYVAGAIIWAVVARKNPVPERERQIGKRLRGFRDILRLSRVVMADELKIGVSSLASYEAGRVPMPFDVAQRIAGAFRLSLEWLAEGNGEPVSEIILTPELKSKVPARALFSEAYDRTIKPELVAEGSKGQSAFKAAVEANPKAKKMMQSFRVVGVSKPQAKEMLSSLVNSTLDEIPTHLVWPYYRQLCEVSAKYLLWENGKESFTLRNASVTNTDVKALWPVLKKRLQAATADRGGKSALAQFLGVKVQAVSQWLTDNEESKREPGAETALRMLKWVEQQERK